MRKLNHKFSDLQIKKTLGFRINEDDWLPGRHPCPWWTWKTSHISCLQIMDLLWERRRTRTKITRRRRERQYPCDWSGAFHGDWEVWFSSFAGPWTSSPSASSPSSTPFEAATQSPVYMHKSSRQGENREGSTTCGARVRFYFRVKPAQRRLVWQLDKYMYIYIIIL